MLKRRLEHQIENSFRKDGNQKFKYNEAKPENLIRKTRSTSLVGGNEDVETEAKTSLKHG